MYSNYLLNFVLLILAMIIVIMLIIIIFILMVCIDSHCQINTTITMTHHKSVKLKIKNVD